MFQLHVNLNTLSFCNVCAHEKVHKLPFGNNNSVVSQSLAIIHFDLWGPSHVVSKEGYKYYISFVDSCIRFTWIFPLIYKFEALNVFIQFKTQVKK
jgi:hypothetical protein